MIDEISFGFKNREAACGFGQKKGFRSRQIMDRFSKPQAAFFESLNPSFLQRIGKLLAASSKRKTQAAIHPFYFIEFWWTELTEFVCDRRGAGNLRRVFVLVTCQTQKRSLAKLVRRRVAFETVTVFQNTSIYLKSPHKICFSFLPKPLATC